MKKLLITLMSLVFFSACSGNGGGGGVNTPAVPGRTLINIIVDPNASNITVGDSSPSLHTAKGTYSDNSMFDLTSLATWSSSNQSVATVTEGNVAAVSAGTAIITASYGGVSGTAIITVFPANIKPIWSITVVPGNLSVGPGSTQQFVASVLYSDSSTQDLTASVTWNSSTPSVATITSGGKATAIANGSTTITATYGAYSGAVTLAVSGSAPVTTTPTYSVSDLGSLSGFSYYIPLSVNDLGQAVGTGYFGLFRYAILFDKGQATMLGAGTTANGINNFGQIIATAAVPNSFASSVLISNGVSTNFGNLGYQPPFPQIVAVGTYALGLNNLGQAVGYAITASNYNHAALFSNGKLTDLGTLIGGAYSTANSINDNGQAVGSSVSAAFSHAVMFSNGNVTDLGTLAGYPSSIANSINNVGFVVGSIQGLPANHAASFSNGTVSDLGILVGGTDCAATCVNNSGQIVGYSDNLSGVTHAVIFSNRTVIDLNDLIDPKLGWILSSATSINNKGQIIGSGLYNGKSRAFILTLN